MTVLVTGATGNVGRPLVNQLISEGARVRALTRNTANHQLSFEADVVVGDPGHPDTIAEALRDVTAVFLNPAAIGSVVQHVLDTARGRALSRVVLLSSFAVRDGGTQTTSIGAHHRQLEQAVEDSGLEWTFLRCGGFATNTLGWAPQIRNGGVVRGPYAHAVTAPIAEHDIAAATWALLDHGHVGKTYVLTGPESLTQIDQLNLIGRAIGRQLHYEEIAPEVFRAAAVGHMRAEAVDDLLRYWAEYVDRTAEMSDDFRAITREPPTTFAAWAKSHAHDFS